MTQFSAHIDEIVAVAREAGKRIEQVRQEGQKGQGRIAVETKADDSPVTRADREADALLRDALPKIIPAAWLSEETRDDRARLDERLVWIVDPLDGTKEFIGGIPEYTVAIALAEAGEPVLGVIHNPVTAVTWWATRGAGAYRDGERLRVREGDVMLASRSEMRAGEFDPFTDWNLTPTGSIEYKLALIASGAAAATVSRGPKHEWDVCAGAVIVRESGGIATDAFGGPLTFNQSFPKVKGILAGAPKAYARCLALVQQLGGSERMEEMTRRE